MNVDNILFEKLLKINNFTKKDFSDYAAIPYNTVVGWKKRNHIPPYALVIFKDMNYRRKLDLETEKELRKNFDTKIKVNHSLTKNEEERLKSVFWGTNYTIIDIVLGIREKNQKMLKRLKDNLPFNIQSEILAKVSNA